MVIVSDDSTGVMESRSATYADAQKEKITRGALKTAIDHALTAHTVVIADSLNYIKGYRYELFCMSKGVSTTHAVLHVATNTDTCKLWNAAREQEHQYPPHTLDELVMRYECPEPTHRWDKPLFTITPSDPLPIDELWAALIHARPLLPNIASLPQPIAPTTFMYELDRITNDIVTVCAMIFPLPRLVLTQPTLRL